MIVSFVKNYFVLVITLLIQFLTHSRRNILRSSDGKTKNKATTDFNCEKSRRILFTCLRWLLLEDDLFTCLRCKRDIRSRVDLYSANNDMILVASQQNYKALAKWRNCSLRIMSIYRKQGGQSVSRYTGFLNIFPANVSDLPILVIRKQGAGECQYWVHASFTSAWKRRVPLYTYTTFILCAGPIIWSKMWMISAEIWLQSCFVLSNHLFLRICNSTRRKVTRANSFLSATILLNVLTDLLPKICTDRFASKYTIILFLTTVRNTANTS